MGDVVVDDEDFNDEDFLDELFRATDNAVASRNPNPTTAPTSISISHLPAASASASTSLRFTPPRELTQRIYVLFLTLLILTTAEGAEPCQQAS